MTFNRQPLTPQDLAAIDKITWRAITRDQAVTIAETWNAGHDTHETARAAGVAERQIGLILGKMTQVGVALRRVRRPYHRMNSGDQLESTIDRAKQEYIYGEKRRQGLGPETVAAEMGLSRGAAERCERSWVVQRHAYADGSTPQFALHEEYLAELFNHYPSGFPVIPEARTISGKVKLVCGVGVVYPARAA